MVKIILKFIGQATGLVLSIFLAQIITLTWFTDVGSIGNGDWDSAMFVISLIVLSMIILPITDWLSGAASWVWKVMLLVFIIVLLGTIVLALGPAVGWW